MKNRLRLAAVVAGFALAATACESGGTPPSVAGPSTTAAVTAKIVHSSATPNGGHIIGFVGQPSLGGGVFVGSIGQPCAARQFPLFDLLVTAGGPTSVSQVTIQLIDGSSPGAAITFPQPGSTPSVFQIAAGATQTFTFQPALACGVPLPALITGTVSVVDPIGTTQTVTATASLQ